MANPEIYADSLSGEKKDKSGLLVWLENQRKKVVAIISESEEAINKIKTHLEERGAKVYPFTNPFEAINKIGELEPKTILIDVDLERIDSYELYRKLKGSEEEKNK